MKSIAVRKVLRTIAQLIVSGGLTAAVNAVAGGLTANNKVLVLTGWTIIVTLAQNLLEQSGTIPTLLPTSSPTVTQAPQALVHSRSVNRAAAKAKTARKGR